MSKILVIAIMCVAFLLGYLVGYERRLEEIEELTALAEDQNKTNKLCTEALSELYDALTKVKRKPDYGRKQAH